MRELLETAYTHDADCNYFTVSACERWSITMVKRLKRERPDEVKIVRENPDGTLMAHIPFEWMRIVPKRATSNPNGTPVNFKKKTNTNKLSL